MAANEMLEQQQPSSQDLLQKAVAVLLALVGAMGTWIGRLKRRERRARYSYEELHAIMENSERWRSLERRIERIELQRHEDQNDLIARMDSIWRELRRPR